MKNPDHFEDPTPLLFQDNRDLETMMAFLEQEGVLSEA